LCSPTRRASIFFAEGFLCGCHGDSPVHAWQLSALCVDFDGDGRRDIGNNAMDAIGSVANYLAAHGWRPDQPVAVPAQVAGEQYRALLGVGFDSMRDIGELQQMGVTAMGVPLARAGAVTLVGNQQRSGILAGLP